jgi:hypothetical protein
LFQGNGKAAFVLGVTLIGTDQSLGEDNARALHVLHEGIKLGSQECAAYVYLSFLSGEQLVNNVKDQARGERYEVLADALRRDPDLRLPNLDKVLPLPPAVLPQWDGTKQTLIDAAKAILPTRAPEPVPHSSTQRTGRAYVSGDLTDGAASFGVDVPRAGAAPTWRGQA